MKGKKHPNAIKRSTGKTHPPTRGGARNPISFECERAEYKERRTGKVRCGTCNIDFFWLEAVGRIMMPRQSTRSTEKLALGNKLYSRILIIKHSDLPLRPSPAFDRMTFHSGYRQRRFAFDRKEKEEAIQWWKCHSATLSPGNSIEPKRFGNFASNPIRRETPGRRALGTELKWIVEQIWMQKSRSPIDRRTRMQQQYFHDNNNIGGG